jgi:hypothetical protein
MAVYDFQDAFVTETTSANLTERKVTTKLRAVVSEGGFSTTYDVTVSRTQSTSGGTPVADSPFDPTKQYRVVVEEEAP